MNNPKANSSLSRNSKGYQILSCWLPPSPRTTSESSPPSSPRSARKTALNCPHLACRIFSLSRCDCRTPSSEMGWSRCHTCDSAWRNGHSPRTGDAKRNLLRRFGGFSAGHLSWNWQTMWARHNYVCPGRKMNELDLDGNPLIPEKETVCHFLSAAPPIANALSYQLEVNLLGQSSKPENSWLMESELGSLIPSPAWCFKGICLIILFPKLVQA